MPTTHRPDEPADLATLLSRVAMGDRAAFQRLYNSTASTLLAQVMRIERNQASAEDILQEVYVKVWRSAAGFDIRLSKPQTWLGSIARHCAIDHIRRRQAQPQTLSSTVPGDEGEDDRDLLQDFVNDQPGPAEQMEQSSEAQALRHCLGVLSAQQSQAVALAYYQGLSYGEVADHLRQPLGTVKSWVRRGLLALRSCLERGPARA